MRRVNSSTNQRFLSVKENFDSRDAELGLLRLKDTEKDSRLALMQDQLDKVSAQLDAMTDQQKLMPVEGTRTYLPNHLSGFTSLPVSRRGSMNGSMNGSRQSAFEAGVDDTTYTAPLLQTSSPAPNQAILFRSGFTEFFDDEALPDGTRSLQESFESHSMPHAQWSHLLARSAEVLRENSAGSVAKTALMAQRREAAGVQHI